MSLLSARAEAGHPLHPHADPLAKTDRWIRLAQGEALSRWGLFAAELFLAGALTGLALWGLADLFFDLAPTSHKIIRAAYLLAACGGFGALLALVLKHIPKRGEVALRLESATPTFQGNLLAAVEALERPESVPDAVAEHAAERALKVLRETGTRAVLPRLPWTKAHYWLLSAMAVTLSAAMLFGPDFFRAFMRGLFPFEAVESALALKFERVRPGQATAVEGDPLGVDALLSGGRAGAVYVQIREASAENGPAPVERALFKTLENGRETWKGSLGVMRKDSVYRLLAYDAEELATRKHPRAVATPWFEVSVRASAEVRRLAVLVESPAYTGYAPKWYTNPDTVQALARSNVTVLVAAGPAGDLGEGAAELPGGTHAALERLYDKEGLTFYRVGFTVERSGLVQVALAPSNESHVGAQAVFALSVVQDLPPISDAAIPADAQADAQGLPIELRLQDDIGLTGARLVVATLPADESRADPLAEREIFYEIPIPFGRREVSERWVIPAQGFEAWLASGFQYQVVAYDCAQPLAQNGKSPWRRWQPSKSARARNETAGMLDEPAKAPRSLVRQNAMGKIPDVSTDDLSKLKGAGSGVRPNQLQRPNSERLEGGKLPGNESSNKPGQGGQGAAGSKAGSAGQNSDNYEKPQGLGGPQQPQPKGQGASGQQPGEKGEGDPNAKEHGKEGEPQGAKQGGEQKNDGKDQPGAQGSGKEGKEGEQGIGTQPGGKSPGGEGKTTGKGEGGSGSGPQGDGKGDGAGNDPGGADGVPDPNDPGAEGAGGSGQDGQKKKDGGQKSGREVGAGGGKMAPPDLETLARMKGISLEEAKKYALAKRVVDARTDFGANQAADAKRTDSDAVSNYATFDGSTLTPDKVTKKAAAKSEKDAAPSVRLDRVDPAYLPLVQAYFRRMQASKQAEPADESAPRK
ncbi:MAG: hypothetical protein HY291_14710 [Planctomycetes bacterium]|nr:hypothetical protein [Planctomycetota bacterium]